MVYFISSRNSQASQHPIDAFLTGIAPTLKTLNPYLLNLAKSEIFSTVQKYEIKCLESNIHIKEKEHVAVAIREFRDVVLHLV